MPRMKMPVRKVRAAAQRNHQSARHVSLSKASPRAAGLSSAYAGTWTKLKKYSRPIHVMPPNTWNHRNSVSKPV